MALVTGRAQATWEGKQFDMMVYPNEHHGIEGARLHLYTRIANYFRNKL